MKIVSAKNALLLTAFLGCLPRPTLQAPVTQAAQVTDLQVTPRGGNSSLVPVDQANEAKIIPRTEDDSYPQPANDVARIETRGFDPPHPPPLPKIVPRPGGSQGPVVVPRPVIVKQPSPPRPPPPQPHPDWKPITVDTNPGVGLGLGRDPRPMEEYAQSGQQQLDGYENVVKSGKPDTPIVQSNAELANYGPNEAFLDIRQIGGYDLRVSAVATQELGKLKSFKTAELGFDIKDPKLLKQVVVTQKNKHEPINRGTYDPDGNFIVYQDAFKEANDKVIGKLPLNEINMQNFINVAGSQTKNFKAAFLTNIQNKEFWAITRQNYNDMKQPFDQSLTFERGTPQFDRYMGSPNFNSKFYSFGNHHQAIGNKIPDKVVVIPKQAQGEGGQLNVAVVFKAA